jgi:hypothetical protein
VPGTVLSVNAVEPVIVDRTPFTVKDMSISDARYLKTTVSHKFCVIAPIEMSIPALILLFLK